MLIEKMSNIVVRESSNYEHTSTDDELDNLMIGDDGASPHKRRFGTECETLTQIPFGAKVEFKPQGKRLEGLPKFAPRMLPGLFIGYHLQPGGRFSGDYIVADLEDITGQAKHIRLHRIKELLFEAELGIEFPANSVAAVKGVPLAITEQTEAELEPPPEFF